MARRRCWPWSNLIRRALPQALQAKLGEKVGHACRKLLLRHIWIGGTQRHHDFLGNSECEELQTRVLEDQANGTLDRKLAGRATRARDGMEQRGLAAAAFAHESSHATVSHLERNTREHGGRRPASPIANGQVANTDNLLGVLGNERGAQAPRPLVIHEQAVGAHFRLMGRELRDREARLVKAAMLAHKHDAVREGQPPTGTMVDHHERHALLLVESAKLDGDRGTRRRIEIGEWLIEHERAGTARERGAQRELLLGAAGELADAVLLAPLEAHEREELATALAHVARPSDVFERKEHLALDRIHAELVVRILEQYRDFAASLARTHLPHRTTSRKDLALELACIGRVKPGEAEGERRLARPGGPHHEDDLPSTHGQGEVGEDRARALAIAKAQATSLERDVRLGARHASDPERSP